MSSASTIPSTRSRGVSAARAPTTRITARRSSRRAGSFRPPSIRCSRAGRRRSTSARAGRSTRTRARSTYSNIADVSYKRLTKTINVPAGGGDLSFQVSHDTEPAWDHVFVEAHTVGQDDWTTLPDQNGHTSTSTGDSCPEAGARCIRSSITTRRSTPTTHALRPARPGPGTRPQPGGWGQWSVDLSAYAGTQVEVSLRTSATGRSRGSARSWTTSSSRPATARPRSRPAWTVGRLPARRTAARRTRTLHPHERRGVPRRRGDHDRGHDLLRFRLRGDRDSCRAERRHGRSDLTTCSPKALRNDAPGRRGSRPERLPAPCLIGPIQNQHDPGVTVLDLMSWLGGGLLLGSASTPTSGASALAVREARQTSGHERPDGIFTPSRTLFRQEAINDETRSCRAVRLLCRGRTVVRR